MGTKIREAVKYYPSLVHLEPIVTVVIVWLPGPEARDRDLTFYKSDRHGRLASWVSSWAGCCRL
jgi:hypothetical protein